MTRPDPVAAPGRHAQGFALLEALVAILLFVLGILGLMGLQASMTLAQTETRARSEAAYLAQELIGLMWADIGNIDDYAITAGTPGVPGGAPPTSASCTAGACERWLAKMQNVLPQGNAESTITATSGNDSTNAAITIYWTMPNGDMRRYDTATNIAVSFTP